MSPPLEHIQDNALLSNTVAAGDFHPGVVAELELDGVGCLFGRLGFRFDSAARRGWGIGVQEKLVGREDRFARLHRGGIPRRARTCTSTAAPLVVGAGGRTMKERGTVATPLEGAGDRV